MKHGFIFDLDGVLVDTVEYHFDSWVKLSHSLGFKIDESIKESLKGISRMASLDIVLRVGAYKATQAEKIELAKKKNDWYLQSLLSVNDNVILDGVKFFLNLCVKNNIPICVGSASKNAKTIIAKTSLKDMFSIIVDGNDVKNPKPDPEVFLKGAHHINLAPRQCIIFEDSRKGLEAAVKGGFKTVGIGTAHNLSNAQIVISNLKDIHPLTVIRLLQ